MTISTGKSNKGAKYHKENGGRHKTKKNVDRMVKKKFKTKPFSINS